MDGLVVPNRNNGGIIYNNLVHLTVKDVTDRIIVFLQGTLIQNVKGGVAVTGIIRRAGIFAVKHSHIILGIGIIGYPTSTKKKRLLFGGLLQQQAFLYHFYLHFKANI